MNRIIATLAIIAATAAPSAAQIGPDASYSGCLMDRIEAELETGTVARIAWKSAVAVCPVPMDLKGQDLLNALDYAAHHMGRVVAGLDGSDGTAPELDATSLPETSSQPSVSPQQSCNGHDGVRTLKRDEL